MRRDFTCEGKSPGGRANDPRSVCHNARWPPTDVIRASRSIPGRPAVGPRSLLPDEDLRDTAAGRSAMREDDAHLPSRHRLEAGFVEGVAEWLLGRVDLVLDGLPYPVHEDLDLKPLWRLNAAAVVEEGQLEPGESLRLAKIDCQPVDGLGGIRRPSSGCSGLFRRKRSRRWPARPGRSARCAMRSPWGIRVSLRRRD